jgi:hypothetical protein
MPEYRSERRKRFALAFKAAAQLESYGRITGSEKGALKDLTLDGDPRIVAALDRFFVQGGRSEHELLDAFLRIAQDSNA